MNLIRCFLILTFSACSTGWAQLKWETRSLEFHPAPSDSKVVANYVFTNTGSKPIKIKEVRTSCGCTTASLDKEVYAPGEKGKITAVFDIDSRTGVQEKTIYVATNDPKEPELVLRLKATIPMLLDIDTIFLNWLKDEPLTPKIVNVKVSPDYPIHNITVTSTNPNMGTEVKRAANGRDFQIIVTPKKTGAELSAKLEVSPDFPKEPAKYFLIYTSVDH